MDKLSLKVQKREITGRKVKQLRKKGVLPGNVYGKGIKSQTVELPVREFIPIYKKAGETKIVNLSLPNKETYPILIHNVHFDPLTRSPLHADFFKVDLTQKIRTKIPVVITGEAPAVTQKIGLLLQTLNEVEIESLPADLPDRLSIDVGSLSKLDQELKVSDIKFPKGVAVLTSKDLGVVKVGKLVSKEAEALAKEEEAQAAAAKAQAAAEASTPSPEAAPTQPTAEAAAKPDAGSAPNPQK